MNPWNPSAHDIFIEALDLDEDKREAFVKNRCDDSHLCAEVFSLLAAYQRAGNLLADDESVRTEPTGETITQVSSAVDSTPKREPSTEDLGAFEKYELQTILGEGGMGTVYLARQTSPVKRDVAIKVIKPGVQSRAVIERFAAERQALAMMDHPGIARVFEAGETPTGLPYFVMELVHGESLTRYSDLHRLTIQERLQLFVDVCLAVQHAHQKGIIHRDLKPSNILVTQVDGRPVVKVIDFGLAKAIEGARLADASETLVGSVMGTPQYMSPEQATARTADIDTRTDIYSLGVILYELIAGSTPLTLDILRSVSMAEVFRLIRESDPQLPSSRISQAGELLDSLSSNRRLDRSQLPRVVRGELDWIVGKALAKERHERYQTVGNLADDVLRYLNHEPVSAGAVSIRYRARKYIRRNRALFAVISAVAASILIALIGTSVGFVRASIAQRHARDAQQLEATQRKLAENALLNETKALQQAEDTISDLYVSRGESSLLAESPATAAIWFAEAALLPMQSGAMRRLHQTQAENALKQVVFPVATYDLGGEAKQIAFSPTGKYFAAWDANNKLTVWSWPSFVQIQSFQAVPCESFDWHPTQDKLAVSGSDHQVNVWDLESNSVDSVMLFSEKITSLKFSPQADRLACAGKNIRVWDLAQSTVDRVGVVLPANVTKMRFNRDADNLCCLLSDHSARLVRLSASDANAVENLPHSDTNSALPIWSLDGLSIYTAAWVSGELSLLQHDTSVTPLRLVDSVPVDTTQVFNMQMSNDGNRLAVCGNQTLKLFDTNNLHAAPNTFPFPNEVRACDFANSSHDLIAVGRSQQAKLIRRRFNDWSICQLPHFGMVTACAANPNANEFATGEVSGRLTIWRDTRTNPVISLASTWWRNVTLSDNARIAVPSQWRESPNVPHNIQLNDFRLLDMKSHELRSIKTSGNGALADCAVNADGSIAALVYDDGTNTILLKVDCDTGIPKDRPLELSNRHVASLDFSPNANHLLILHENGNLVEVDVDTSAIRHAFKVADWLSPNRSQYSHGFARYTPDGQSVVVVPFHGPKVHVYDSTTMAPRYPAIDFRLENSYGICRSIEFSHDGKILATATNAPNAIRFWDISTGQELAEPIRLSGDHIGVFAVAFSPDDRSIITSNFDGYVRQYDWRSGGASGPDLAHPDEVFDAQFVGDTGFVCTVCRDGLWRLWDLATARLACLPVRLGQYASSNVPVAITMLNNSSLCLVTTTHNQLYQIDLKSLLDSSTADPSTLLQLAELASGQFIKSGYLSGMNYGEWKANWKELQPTVLARTGATEFTETDARIRSAIRARSVGADEQELRWLERAYASLPPLPLAGTALDASLEESAKLRATILCRWLELKPQWNGEDTMIAGHSVSEHTDQLLELVTQWSLHYSPPTSLINAVSECWWRSQSLPWTVCVPSHVESTHGTVLAIQNDHSIQASGEAPKIDTYRCTFKLPHARCDALRLEVLANPNGTHGGVGRDKDGNFNLTRIQLWRVIDDERVPIDLQFIQVSYSTLGNNFEPIIHHSVSNGWTTHRYQTMDQWAIVVLADAFKGTSSTDALVLELEFNSVFPAASMSQFRISSTTSSGLSLAFATQEMSGFKFAFGRPLLAAIQLAKDQPQIAFDLLRQVDAVQREKSPLPSLATAIASQRLGQTTTAQHEIDHLFANPVAPIEGPVLSAIAMTAFREIRGSDLPDAQRLMAQYNRQSYRGQLDRWMKSAPDELFFQESSSKWYKAQRSWKEALAAQQAVWEKRSADRMQWLYIAPLQAIVDESNYASFVHAAMEQFKDSQNAEVIESVCKIACLRPGIDGLDRIDMDKCWKKIMAGQAPSYMPQYACCAMAMLEYRKGRYDAVFGWIERCDELDPVSVVRGHAMVFNAMAMLATGRLDDALAQKQVLDNLFPPLSLDEYAGNGETRPLLSEAEFEHDRLILEILRLELKRELAKHER